MKERTMSMIRKSLVAALAVATLGTAVISSAAPASAWTYHPFGWGADAAAATLAAGAAAAAAATVAPVYPVYGACYMTRQPVVDSYGNVVGSHRVRVCN